jgi:SAM-dependent methyltransferase
MLYIYKNLSNWGKILFFLVIFIVLIHIFKTNKEGFQQSDDFIFKSNDTLYDDFYANIYDDLVFNNIKDNYEIGQIINNTKPTTESIILDIGCGTGHHVAEFKAYNFNVVGVDNSAAMIKKAKEYYPQYNFIHGDIINANLFRPNSYTHITCLYFTIYYFSNKTVFFQNCFRWLMPGGFLILHLVNRDMFDPILPPAQGLLLVSPQKYAKKRITNSKIVFEGFNYNANFDLNKSNNKAVFTEKFNYNNNKSRKNEHTFYMESQKQILTDAQACGFLLQGQSDLVHCGYEYQYLYYLTKPE